MRITFVTGNKGKLHEAQTALAPLGHEVVAADLHPVEIQADTLEEISRAKCEVLVGKAEPPFFVDDGGLFVEALHGFPGVFSAHALKTIGVPGILKLMEGVEDRRARMVTVLSVWDGQTIETIRGEASGEIAILQRTAGQGFGYDPIFLPTGSTKTFAEMTTPEKSTCSHRGDALRCLAARLDAARQ